MRDMSGEDIRIQRIKYQNDTILLNMPLNLTSLQDGLE